MEDVSAVGEKRKDSSNEKQVKKKKKKNVLNVVLQFQLSQQRWKGKQGKTHLWNGMPVPRTMP